MKTMRGIRASAKAREVEIAGMPDGPDKRARRRVSRLISAVERLTMDYDSMRSGRRLAPSRLRRLLGVPPSGSR